MGQPTKGDKAEWGTTSLNRAARGTFTGPVPLPKPAVQIPTYSSDVPSSLSKKVALFAPDRIQSKRRYPS